METGPAVENHKQRVRGHPSSDHAPLLECSLFPIATPGKATVQFRENRCEQLMNAATADGHGADRPGPAHVGTRTAVNRVVLARGAVRADTWLVSLLCGANEEAVACFKEAEAERHPRRRLMQCSSGCLPG